MKGKLVYIFPAVFLFSVFFAPDASAQASANGYQMKRIVLDPGHGGKDPGAVGGGYKEKDIVLSIALQVGKLLNESLPDVEVIYTRKTDVYVELMERGNIANRAKADLFLSIHADAAANTGASGSSSWVMGMAREESNLQLAMRENSVITYEENYKTKYEGFDPNDPASYIIFSLMQSVYFDQSVKLAKLFQGQYTNNTTIKSRGVNQNIFIVLHRTTMPSVLTEIGFISNATDRAYITSKAGQEKIARSIFKALCEYKSMVEENAKVAAFDADGQSRQTTSTNTSVSESTAQQSPVFVTNTPDSGVTFRVQVSASPTRVAKNRFGEYANKVVEKKIGNYYKYFVGETKSYAEALSLQRQIRGKYKDAFIVAFDNEKPVTITDAMKRN